MFRLTRQEKQLIAFVLAVFLFGMGVKHYRESVAATDAAAVAGSR